MLQFRLAKRIVNGGDVLTLYLLGPGVGESAVVVMPDARVIVVDSCTRGDVNLPAQVLTRLGVTAIDLLVVTHPDLDHVKGLAALVDRFPPRRVWRYPFALLRDILQKVGRLRTVAGRLRYQEALAAAVALDRVLDSTGTVERVHYGIPWAPSPSYTVHALAPTNYDEKRATDLVNGLIERRDGRSTLTARGRQWLDGERPLGDLPNMVSIGVVIEWGARRVILGGDIENGDGHPQSGWRGVLALLDQPDDHRRHLVDNVDLVKVAHHGSLGAFFEGAWRRHATAGKTVGVLTTYAPTPLPRESTLRSLRPWVRRLGITTDAGGSFDRAHAAGWAVADADAPATLGDEPCLKAEIAADGTVTFDRGTEAGWFQ